MKERTPDLRRGDAFLHNSPYHGNSHAADYSILVPVIDDDGRHRFTVLAKAHQADCGNSIPTTYASEAKDVYEEGALIFPCVRVQSDFEDVEDVVDMCKLRIRVPDQWWGDYLALIGSARIGEQRVMALADEVGWDTLDAFVGGWFDYSERMMAGAISKLPAGDVGATSTHDPYPAVPDGIPVNVRVSVRPDSGRITVDLRDNLDCQPCGLNLSEATTRSGAVIGIFNSLGEIVPINAGSLRRIEIKLRENCIVGIPRHPASCSVATTNVADRLANAVQVAMAELGDGAGQAAAGSGNPPPVSVISGLLPKSGEPFVNQLFLATTGGAGTPQSDGWLTVSGVGCAGMMYIDSVEISELRFPLLVHRQEIEPDTEGAGRFRGAPSARVEFGPVDKAELSVVYSSDGNVHPYEGVRGGLDGGPALQWRRDRKGNEEPLGIYGEITLTPGERIVALTPGGGGYGPPRERARERVLADLREGWITAERANSVYGLPEDNLPSSMGGEPRQGWLSRPAYARAQRPGG